MKHTFYLTLLMIVVAVIAVAGWRGMTSRRPQIELFSDMVRQPKLSPQSPAHALANSTSSQVFPSNTVSYSAAATDSVLAAAIQSGQQPGSTNWLLVNPLPMTSQFLLRGQDRFQIYCTPCHGIAGDGRGVTIKYNMVAMANFHDKRLIEIPDGQIFDTITHGKGLMGAYGTTIQVEDRWAIVGYVRALERSRLGTIEDVPTDIRPAFGK
jgi:mono/diheme cytochrome c family protein